MELRKLTDGSPVGQGLSGKKVGVEVASHPQVELKLAILHAD